MSWILVSDEKPPTDEPVVYAKRKDNGGYAVGIAYWSVSDTWVPECESTRFPDGFTMWSPLPKPHDIRMKKEKWPSPDEILYRELTR